MHAALHEQLRLEADSLCLEPQGRYRVKRHDPLYRCVETALCAYLTYAYRLKEALEHYHALLGRPLPQREGRVQLCGGTHLHDEPRCAETCAALIALFEAEQQGLGITLAFLNSRELFSSGYCQELQNDPAFEPLRARLETKSIFVNGLLAPGKTPAQLREALLKDVLGGVIRRSIDLFGRLEGCRFPVHHRPAERLLEVAAKLEQLRVTQSFA